MKLAVSNIAWTPKTAEQIIPKLSDAGVEALVVAPGMIWPDGASKSQAQEYRRIAADHGLAVTGMQSLTYGLEQASLFGDVTERQRLSERLKRQAALAGALGVSSMVFGSPGMRVRGESVVDDDQIIQFFGGVAHAANDYGTQLVIEPLHGYGNEFVASTNDGIALVQRVNHPGLGLHLDSAAIVGAGEMPLAAVLEANHKVGIASFDVSAPELRIPSGEPNAERHAEFGEALRTIGYAGTIALEMRGPQSIETVLSELAFVRQQYGFDRATMDA